ncbi:hypothetical protein [Bradyrhizobium sp. 18]|uniref:hypothetical protein n=1 Tax=Bradyrhizobium sp. 18 TaxID=2782657 RepID=UPI001FFA38E3|nr:hypothetical protein [Bradyrhizobium sp. 18]MCK1505141.1 hypothetical protein [Bradyrhizobium sp. 18]
MIAAYNERLVGYAMAVNDWDYFYSYIAEPRTRTEVDEFVHLETLELHGKLISPNHQTGRKLTIMLACEKAPAEGQLVTYDRRVLGNLDTSKRAMVAYLLLPAPHVNRIVSVVASNKPLEALLMTTKIYRNKALVRSVNVFTRQCNVPPSRRV